MTKVSNVREHVSYCYPPCTRTCTLHHICYLVFSLISTYWHLSSDEAKSSSFAKCWNSETTSAQVLSWQAIIPANYIPPGKGILFPVYWGSSLYQKHQQTDDYQLLLCKKSILSAKAFKNKQFTILPIVLLGHIWSEGHVWKKGNYTGHHYHHAKIISI